MNELVPKLRFPGFEGSYDNKLLDEIAKRGSGHTPNKNVFEYYNGDIPWISLADSKRLDNGLIEVTETKISEQGIKNSSAVLHPAGSVLLSRDAGIGKSAVMAKDMAVSQHFIVWNGYEQKLSNWYLYYKLQILKPEFERIAIGSTIKTIGLPYFKQLKLAIPDYIEQEKVASFFSTIDKRISSSKEKKSLLEQYKKGLMQKIFSRELRFKDDDGKAFGDWEEKLLDEIGYTFNGLSGKTADDFGAGKPYIQYKQVFDDSKIDVTRFGLVNIRLDEQQPTVQFGDIIFTTSSETPNEVGYSSVLLERVDELYLNSFCFGFRPNSTEDLLPQFAQFLFRSKGFRDQIVKLAQGSTRYNISKVQLLKIQILLPQPKEQTKIANFLSAIDRKIAAVGEQIAQLDTWKKGLLAEMFV